jgi:hypothetical protein
MKIHDLYSDKVLVAGLVLTVLGLGNWIVGAVEGARYQTLVHRAAPTGLEENYALFQQLDQQKNEEVLRRITQDREKYNAARVKLDFFSVVLGGGQLFFLTGVVLTSFGLIRTMRQNAIKDLKRPRLTTQSLSGGP